MNLRIRKRVMPLVLVALLLSACSDNDLKTVAKALDDTAQAVAVLQTTVIEANNQKLLTDAQARPYMELAVKVNLAAKEAVAVTRKINALTPTERTQLLEILKPVIAAVATSKTLPLDDIPSGQKIRLTLALIETSLNTAQIALAVR